MSFSAATVDAETAEKWGLLAKVFPSDSLVKGAIQLAEKISNVDQATLVAYKSTLNHGFNLPLGEALVMERARGYKSYQGLGQTGIGARTSQFHSKL